MAFVEDAVDPRRVGSLSFLLCPYRTTKSLRSDEQQQVFTIAFSKSHGHAGIKFAHVDGLLVVEDIGADYIAQWNSMPLGRVSQVYFFPSAQPMLVCLRVQTPTVA